MLIDIPDDLHDRLKAHSQAKSVSVSDLVKYAIERLLEPPIKAYMDDVRYPELTPVAKAEIRRHVAPKFQGTTALGEPLPERGPYQKTSKAKAKP